MSDFETIIYEKEKNVGWITLNRPEVRNAMSFKLREELCQVMQEIRVDNDVHIVVITGAGDKAFCAGADISTFLEVNAADQLVRYGYSPSFTLVRQIAKPVIAMVNGMAFGGGCELVLASDIAIASENAQFGQLEIRVGVIPGGGGTQLLPRLIGEKRAKDMIFNGSIISAQEALQYGLINQVVPQEKLRETTENYVAELQKRSPIILKLAKLAVNKSLETNLSAGLTCETDLFSMCFSTEDQKEGARAFFEKREANYKGR